MFDIVYGNHHVFAYIQKQLNLNMSGIQGPKRASNCFATLMKWSKHS